MFRDELISAAQSFGLELDGGQLDAFEKFFRLVVEQNRTMNLTTLTEPHDFAVKHVIDSLSAWNDELFRGDETLIDVGTGAGFPGVALKIFRQQLKLCLIDSLNKRVEFLKRVVTELALDGVEIFHGRAEELSRQKTFRERFDIVTSRAVARLNVLLELCVPFVKVGGYFVAMKGSAAKEEAEEAKRAAKTLGVTLSDTADYEIEGGGERHILIYKKIAPTPSAYPRRYAQIKKKPL